MNLKLTETRKKNEIRAKPEGDVIDQAAASAIYAKVEKELKSSSGMESFVFDASGLEQIDPLSVCLFPALKASCESRKINFEIKLPTGELSEKISGALKDSGDAVRHFYGTPRARSPIAYLGEVALRFKKDTVDVLSFLGITSSALLDAARRPGSIRWREALYYLEICGADALPIVALICFLMGLILGFQGAIQLHKFGTDIFLADGVGLSIVKELGPLMVAMICTGRAGSAFAAEIGTMKVGEELDAMSTMGFAPSRFLIIPKLIAMIVAMPLLTVFGDLAGIAGGMSVGVFKLGLPMISYYRRTIIAITPMFFVEGLIKSVVYAVLITLIGCVRGFEAKADAQGVGRSTTSAVVSGIFLIIIADAVMTVLFSYLW